MPDSMLSLARSTNRVCDVVDRKSFFVCLGLLKDLWANDAVAGILDNVLKVKQTFGSNSHNLYSVNTNGFINGLP